MKNKKNMESNERNVVSFSAQIHMQKTFESEDADQKA